ncbi:aldose 1-epimerase family protein [Pediococcus argentinicus]|nr:aldose 1-epimerase family protein [Pediococcus argentinicus]NKZ21499.1 aldose 1-epimerase family protein [Pediococcus argentinicus]
MMVTLKNNFLTVQINEQGAELSSVKNDEGIEYIWQADPEIWGRHAPVLFPNVGRLKDDQYHFQGQTFKMGQHGFARDMKFQVTEQTDTRVVLQLKSSKQSKTKYPFEFVLELIFTLDEHRLNEEYHVFNPSDQSDLLFSIGGHPGFNINLGTNISLDQETLEIVPSKKYSHIPLAIPLSDPEHKDQIDWSQKKTLSREFFKDDAVILELNREQTTLMLNNTDNDHGVALTVDNAPYIGIWSPYPAEGPFVCLEPWWGIADPVNTDGEWSTKLAMNTLKPSENFNEHFEMTFF